MPRQDRVDELRDDRVVVADDAGEQRLAGLQLADEVVADFLLDRSRAAAGPRAARRASEWGRHGPILSELRLSASPPCAIPFFASSRPLVFAHRGGSALAPENTIAAFDNGLALGADGLELDVHLSRDGVVVVHHDATLERTTTPARAALPARAARTSSARAGVPRARRRCSRAIRDDAHHHRAEGEQRRRWRAAVDRRRARGRRGRRVCLGSFGRRVLRAARALEPAHRDERRARGSALGAVSIVVPLAGVARRRTPAIRCRKVAAARASSRGASSTTRTAPAWACRSGPSIPRTPTRGGCSTGASTR